MARRLRVEVPGGLYHVIVRGNQRKSVFLDDRDREEYLKRLAHYRERFEFELLAYCLMSNHVHLAIRRGAPAIQVDDRSLLPEGARTRLGRCGPRAGLSGIASHGRGEPISAAHAGGAGGAL